MRLTEINLTNLDFRVDRLERIIRDVGQITEMAGLIEWVKAMNADVAAIQKAQEQERNMDKNAKRG